MIHYTAQQVGEMIEQHRLYLARRDEAEKHDYRDTEALDGFPAGVKADFRYALLDEFDFSQGDLRGADFRYASLRGCNFQYANLYMSNLHSTNLLRADFRYAVLDFADMWACNARSTDFRYAEMHGADLSGACVKGARFEFANLAHNFREDLG